MLLAFDVSSGGSGIASQIFSLRPKSRVSIYAFLCCLQKRSTHPDLLVSTSSREPPELAVTIAYVAGCPLVRVDLPFVGLALERLGIHAVHRPAQAITDQRSAVCNA